MNGKFLINMDDGRLVFRNPETDKQVNLRPIPDAVVEMIMRGEVTAQDVINAISIKIKESGDFSIEDYIKRSKELNVRKSNPQRMPEREPLADRSEEEISVKEVLVEKEKARPAKKERVKKVSEVIEKDSDLLGDI